MKKILMGLLIILALMASQPVYSQTQPNYQEQWDRQNEMYRQQQERRFQQQLLDEMRRQNFLEQQRQQQDHFWRMYEMFQNQQRQQ